MNSLFWNENFGNILRERMRQFLPAHKGRGFLAALLMKNIVLATLDDGKKRLINEDQVCTVGPGAKGDNNLRHAVVRMSNGEELIVVDPDWDQWENDLFQPK